LEAPLALPYELAVVAVTVAGWQAECRQVEDRLHQYAAVSTVATGAPFPALHLQCLVHLALDIDSRMPQQSREQLSQQESLQLHIATLFFSGVAWFFN